MSEAGVDTDTARNAEAPRSAGAMLREARQAQGMHIAALSAAIKVSQKKLESLEADRIDELPDATFTRALAQTVCRALKIDPAPVLALLPAPVGHRLEQVGEGINAPFRDRPGRREPNDWSMLASPAVWGPLLIVVGAGALYLLPPGWLSNLQLPSSSAPPASAPPASASAPSATTGSSTASTMMAPPPITELVTPPAPVASTTSAASDAPTGVAATAPSASAAATAPLDKPSSVGAGGAVLQLHTKGRSWVEVQDARSKVLLSRLVEAGETVSLDGEAPLHLKIGNAGATEVMFRGQALDLAPSTRDNVARLELK